MEQRVPGDVEEGFEVFQYNYCFGGTLTTKEMERIEKSFNTTIVSVEQAFL